LNLCGFWKVLVPDHNTIANFRKNNTKDIARVFRATVKLATHFELIDASLVAGDSAKLRAQNLKKNNFNPNKIERHIAHIDAKLEEYNSALAKEDGDVLEKQIIAKKIKKHSIQKQKYIGYQACQTCDLYKKCTKNAQGRLIERFQYAHLIYQNKVKIENNYEIYHTWHAIVEHPYGVIKRQ